MYNLIGEGEREVGVVVVVVVMYRRSRDPNNASWFHLISEWQKQKSVSAKSGLPIRRIKCRCSLTGFARFNAFS